LESPSEKGISGFAHGSGFDANWFSRKDAWSKTQSCGILICKGRLFSHSDRPSCFVDCHGFVVDKVFSTQDPGCAPAGGLRPTETSAPNGSSTGTEDFVTAEAKNVP